MIIKKPNKDDIVEKISKLDDFYRDIINELYENSERTIVYNSKDIREKIDINKIDNKKDRYDLLDDISNKSGIYCFVDSDGTPVYVGMNGLGGDDLKKRVRVEHKSKSEDTGATLSINIQKINELFGMKITEKESIEIIKQFKVITIGFDKKNSNTDIKNIKRLEEILIHLFRPIYNLKYSISQI